MIAGRIKLNNILDSNHRLEGEYFLNDYSVSKGKLQEFLGEKLTLGELARVFNPPMFKRKYGSETGQTIPFYQSSDVELTEPVNSGWINLKQAESLEVIVKSNWILLTGYGSIGNCRLVDDSLNGSAFADNVCRVQMIQTKVPLGYVYAFLSSKYGKAQLNLNASGSVIKYIKAPEIRKTIIPILDTDKMEKIHELILLSTTNRESALKIIKKCRCELLSICNLHSLKAKEYEAYSNSRIDTDVSTFCLKSSSLKIETINAFNYSEKIRRLKENISKAGATELYKVLDNERIIKTSAFKRLELDNNRSKKLLGQREVFTTNKVGKQIARLYIPSHELVDLNEVVIAGVGTLGESEVFCRCEYAGKELAGECIVGEFLRLKTKSNWHPGYIYAWLSSEYGFRLLRSIQAGTKLCRPIPKLLLNIPVPVLNEELRNEIGNQIEHAYNLRYEALQLEKQAISMIEKEIG